MKNRRKHPAFVHSPFRGPLALQVSALALAALLTGCSYSDLKPRSHLQPPGDASETLAHSAITLSPAAWPTETWWTSFDDKQLDGLVEEALAQSPTLRSAAARVRQAGALEAIEGASLLPSMDMAASTTRERFSANGTTPAPVKGTWQNVNQMTLNVGYELDFWGKNRAAVEAAVGRRHALELDSRAAALMLSASVVQTYIALQDTYEQLDVAQALLDQQVHIEKLTQQRFTAELGTQIDIKQSQASLPASRANIAALQEMIELNQNKLASLLGQGPDRGRSITRPHLRTSNDVVLPSNIPPEWFARPSRPPPRSCHYLGMLSGSYAGQAVPRCIPTAPW